MATSRSSPQPFFTPPYRTPDGSPSKRQRLSQGPSLSRANSVSASVNDVDRAREASRMRLLNAWSQLAERYTKGLDEDDIIDLRTGTLVKDRGILRNTSSIEFGGIVDTDDGACSESPFDEDVEEEDGDELNCIQEGTAALRVPPVREMDPDDAEDLREFLEAEQKLKGLGGEDDLDLKESSEGWEEEAEEEGQEGKLSMDNSVAGAGASEGDALTESDDDLSPYNDLWDDIEPSDNFDESLRCPSSAVAKPVPAQDMPDSDDEFGAWANDEASSFRFVSGPRPPQSPDRESDGLLVLDSPQPSSGPSKPTNHPPRKAAAGTSASATPRAKQASSSKSVKLLMPPPLHIPNAGNTQLQTPPRSHSSFSSVPPIDFAALLPTPEPSSSPLPPSSPTPSSPVAPLPMPKNRGRPPSAKTLAARAKASADLARATAESAGSASRAGGEGASASTPHVDFKQIQNTVKRRNKPSALVTPSVSSDTGPLRNTSPPHDTLSSQRKAKALHSAQTPAPPDSRQPSTSSKAGVWPPKHLQVEVVIPVVRKAQKAGSPKGTPSDTRHSADITPRSGKGKDRAIVVDSESSASEAELSQYSGTRSTKARLASPTPSPKKHTVKAALPNTGLRPALKHRHVSPEVGSTGNTFSASRSPSPLPKGKKRRRSSGFPAQSQTPVEFVDSEHDISSAGRRTQAESLSPSKRQPKADLPHHRSFSAESESLSASSRPSRTVSPPMRTRSRSRSRRRDPSSDVEHGRAHDYEPSSMYEPYPPTSSSVPVTPRRRHHQLENRPTPGHRYATPVDDPRVQSILSYAMTQISYLWAHDDPPAHGHAPLPMPMPMPMHAPSHAPAWPPFTPVHTQHAYPYSFDPALSRGTLPPSSPPVGSSSASSSPVKPRRRRASVSYGTTRARSASRGRRVSFMDDKDERDGDGDGDGDGDEVGEHREADDVMPVRGRSKGVEEVERERGRVRGRSTSVKRI